MHNMDEQARTRKNGLLLSGALIGLILISLVYANIVSRWGSFRGLFGYLMAFIVWMVWITHLG